MGVLPVKMPWTYVSSRRGGVQPRQRDAMGLKLARRLLACFDGEVGILHGVRGSHEARSRLPAVDTVQLERLVEGEAHWRRNLEAQHRAEAVDAERKALRGPPCVDARCEALSRRVERREELVTSLDDVVEHGARGGHAEWVLAVRATCELGGALEEFGAPGDAADGVAATERLTVAGEIAPDPEALLHAACRHAEAGDHLVKHEHDAAIRRERSQSSEKVGGHGGRAVCMASQKMQAIS